MIADDSAYDPAFFLDDYQAALNANNYNYEVWNCFYRGRPDSAAINSHNYQVIIWAIPSYGYFGNSGNSALRQALKSYLDHGGNLFISGEDIAYYIDYLERDKKLMQDYFHARFISDNSGCTKIEGVANDPIADGIAITLSSGFNTDEIDPIAPAITILTYQPTVGTASLASEQNSHNAEPGDRLVFIPEGIDSLESKLNDKTNPTVSGISGSGSAGIRINSGIFKIVHFSFNFHEILDATTKTQLMNRIINWLSPPTAISGQVSYYAQPDSLSIDNVKILLSGGKVDSTVTDRNGMYQFSNLSPAPIVITPEKSDSVKFGVSAYDAALILRYLYGAISLVPYQMIAADVTGDDSITTADATYILKYSVGAIDEFPIKKSWTFVPHDFPIDAANWSIAPRKRALASVDSSITDQNFYAIIYGDVSGNWQPLKKILARDRADELLISNLVIESSFQADQNKLSLSIGLKQTEDLYAISLSIHYDPGLLKAVAVRSTRENQNYTISYHIDQDIIKIGLAGSSLISSTNPLVLIDFAPDKVILPKSTNPIQITEISWNDYYFGNLNIAVDLDFRSELPTCYDLAQNYPNPFNSQTIIKYQLPADARVMIEIFNLLGQRVRLLLDEEKKAGYYQLNWEGRDDVQQTVSSGVYLCYLKAGLFKKMRKMILMR